MVLSRNQFFLIFSIIFLGPFLIQKIIWIAKSRETMGQMWFMGHTLEVQSISDHPVIRFRVGNDSIFFNSPVDHGYEKGESVPVRYQSNHPSDARVSNFIGLWGDTIVYALLPLLILVVLFFTPEKFNPIFPKKARVVLGIRPLVKIVV